MTKLFDGSLSVSVSSNTPEDQVKVWAKAISGVDIEQIGGYALKGDFLEPRRAFFSQEVNTIANFSSVSVAYFSAVPSTVQHKFARRFDGEMVAHMPVVVGVTFQGSNNAGRHAFVCEALENVKSSQSWDDNLGGGVTIVGNFYPLVSYHGGDGWNVHSPKFFGGGDFDAGIENINNPYHATAQFVERHMEYFGQPMLDYKAAMASKPSAPINLYTRPFIAPEDSTDKIALPDGVYSVAEINGIVILGIEQNGKRSFALLDEIANRLEEVEDKRLFEIIEDQAAKLEALAMTYRIIALAGKDDTDETDENAWLM